ncbi:60S acidic ribosomal protein P2 [Entomortierella chlamydospora]|nr:60S acidic ribosomal protein P2 [Entomortierella chlamydospora]
MKYLAAYLLLTIGGNASPSASDITSLLATVGIEAESERIETLISQLSGKDVNEYIKVSRGHLTATSVVPDFHDSDPEFVVTEVVIQNANSETVAKLSLTWKTDIKRE